MNTQILIIGKPHSTKTTFLTQFYAKLVTKKSCMSISKPSENITAIKEAYELLANGDETKPSPTDRNVGLNLAVEHNGKQFDLYCPDYGGEQINSIIVNRVVDEKWQKAIAESNNWILFIRPTNLATGHDLSNKTIEASSLEKKSSTEEEYTISDQSAFIELLQILLHSKGNDSHKKNNTVKLTIAITCWDEIENLDETEVSIKKETPKEKLNQFLPLLLNFIETNWESDKINITGISPQGFRLTSKENKDKYQINGNESYGYLIRSNGEKSNDITELISGAI